MSSTTKPVTPRNANIAFAGYSLGATARRQGAPASQRSRNAPVAAAATMASDPPEDAAYVQRELDEFETLKVRRLAPTLVRDADAAELASSAPRRSKQAEQRKGNGADRVVLHDGKPHHQFGYHLESGVAQLNTWLLDVMALRSHPFALLIGQRGWIPEPLHTVPPTEYLPPSLTSVFYADQELFARRWFEHSHRNAAMTLVNPRTGMNDLLHALLDGPTAKEAPVYISPMECERFYALLNDRKGHTLDFPGAASKLRLATLTSQVPWECTTKLFLSGAIGTIHHTDYVCANDFGQMLRVLEQLIADPSDVLTCGSGPSFRSEARSDFRRMMDVLRGDVAAFAAQHPDGKPLMMKDAILQFPPTSAFALYARCGWYPALVREAATWAEGLSRRAREEHRHASFLPGPSIGRGATLGRPQQSQPHPPSGSSSSSSSSSAGISSTPV